MIEQLNSNTEGDGDNDDRHTSIQRKIIEYVGKNITSKHNADLVDTTIFVSLGVQGGLDSLISIRDRIFIGLCILELIKEFYRGTCYSLIR